MSMSSLAGPSRAGPSRAGPSRAGPSRLPSTRAATSLAGPSRLRSLSPPLPDPSCLASTPGSLSLFPWELAAPRTIPCAVFLPPVFSLGPAATLAATLATTLAATATIRAPIPAANACTGTLPRDYTPAPRPAPTPHAVFSPPVFSLPPPDAARAGRVTTARKMRTDKYEYFVLGAHEALDFSTH